MSTHPDIFAPASQLALPQFDFVPNGLHGGTSVFTNGDKFIKTGLVGNVMSEVVGYDALRSSPLVDHIPKVTFIRQDSAKHEGVLITESCNRILGNEANDFRKLMAKGKIEPASATRILDEYMELSLEWIEKNSSNTATEEWPFRSMQREEWEEVQHELFSASNSFASSLNISGQRFMEAPLIINGQELPSIGTIWGSLNNLYRQDPLKMVAGDLDMSPKNTIANPEGMWMRIDAERIGRFNLPEGLAVAIKGDKTLSTAQDVRVDVRMGDNGIHITPSYAISRAAKAYTERGLELVDQIGTTMDLLPLRSHVLSYLAGNSTHEGAFAAKKQTHPENAFLSFAFAAESIALASGQISEPVIHPTSVF